LIEVVKMKSLKWTKAIWLSVVLFPGMASLGSVAAMPANEYACQVIAAGGQIGLVLVQADTRALAEKAALGADAFTMDNARSPATRVVQCIRRGAETFADYQFQQFFESVPL
jgi:hypothetical protein